MSQGESTDHADDTDRFAWSVWSVDKKAWVPAFAGMSGLNAASVRPVRICD